MSLDTLGAIIEHPRLFAIPVFADNYVWALRSASGTGCLVVDPGDAGPVADWLARNALTLTAILITHHHADHTGGLRALGQTGVPVYGPRHEQITGVNNLLTDGDRIEIAGFGAAFQVIDVPGHTAGHIAYLGTLDNRPLLFCGDTLFSGGCGRLFEGTAEEMYASLQRLAALPPDTVVCCTHEYTLGNLRFAAAVEPENEDIAACTRWARMQRAAGLPTVPGDLARELRINPFLRTQQPQVRTAVRRHTGEAPELPQVVFAALRRWKDGFH